MGSVLTLIPENTEKLLKTICTTMHEHFQARIKQANRRAELWYREVEVLNAWASLCGMPSRQEQLNEGWRLILLNQFHDVLPGSSIREVYDDAERIYAEAQAIGQHIYDHPQDFQATLDGVNAGLLAPERTVQKRYPAEEAAAALAAVREIPGKTWIDFTGWQA